MDEARTSARFVPLRFTYKHSTLPKNARAMARTSERVYRRGSWLRTTAATTSCWHWQLTANPLFFMYKLHYDAWLHEVYIRL